MSAMSEQVYIDPPSGRRYYIGPGGQTQWLDTPIVPAPIVPAVNGSQSTASRLSDPDKAVEMVSLILAVNGLFWSAVPLVNNAAFVFALLAAFGALIARVRIGRFGWPAIATLVLAVVTVATVILSQAYLQHQLGGILGTPGV